MKPKMTRVNVRVPKPMLDQVRHIAKLAGVTPTQVYCVLIALHVAKQPPSAALPGDSNERP